ncbi:MAG: transcriptional regulator [Devosia sp.]|nr:transcriptional regulator [Devosia sp.]
MPMKNPSHPGQIVKSELEFLGVSIAGAAAGLGVSRQQLYRVVRGQSGISADMALRLEQAIGSTADHWLRMQIAYDLAQARLRTQPVVKKFEPKSEAA